MFDYLKKCIEDENANGIKGIITLIITILKEVDNPGEVLDNSDDINIYNNGLDYTFVCPERKFKNNIIIGANEPVWSVRDKLCYYTNIPLNTIFLKNNKKFIDSNDDFKLFKEISHPSFIIEISIRQNLISTLKVNPSSMLKENKKLFKVLFELLKNSHESNYYNINYY